MEESSPQGEGRSRLFSLQEANPLLVPLAEHGEQPPLGRRSTISYVASRLPKQLSMGQSLLRENSPILRPKVYRRQFSAVEETPSEWLHEEKVKEFLDGHRDFLEEFVLDNVDLATLERWFIRKGRLRAARKSPAVEGGGSQARKSSNRLQFHTRVDRRQILDCLAKEVHEHSSSDTILLRLAEAVKEAINADNCIVYIAENKSLYRVAAVDGKQGEPLPICEGESIPSYVAKKRESVRFGDVRQLPPHVIAGLGTEDPEAVSVLCLPILQADGELVAVVELTRGKDRRPFTPEEEEIASSYFAWGGIAIEYAQLYKSLDQHKKLGETILGFMKEVIEDVTRIDYVLEDIITAACALVDADRGSLFLVDADRQELYARVFDLESVSPSMVELAHDWTIGRTRSMTGDDELDQLPLLRVPIGHGIAGYVARTGEVLNIHDCYEDERFNREVDERTGYRTKTILCMPIKNGSDVIGVMEMVNKKEGVFTAQDVISFEALAAYCGIAIQSSMLYIQLKRSKQHHKVATEVLAYHRQINDTEVKEYLERPLDVTAGYDINSHDLDTASIPSDVKALLAMKMMDNLVDTSGYTRNTLMRFVLTVRKCYRPVAYHNWNHAFSVAHASYVMMTRTRAFEEQERIGLFVACLCHDLDHRGYNNDFMKRHDTPLATLYSTSVLENHHFNMAASIIQDEASNIFLAYAPSDFKKMLNLIRKAILATDLARFFKNRQEFELHLENKTLDVVGNSKHRDLMMSLVMTGCDVAASSKQWDVHKATAMSIIQEFYQQGDKEKALGLTPIPIMDRTLSHLLPKQQVGFIKNIVVLCYSTVVEVLPAVQVWLDGAKANLARWSALVEEEEQ